MSNNPWETWIFRDYYALLGISSQATDEEVTKAFWKKAPSLKKATQESKSAEQEFVDVVEAYQALSHSQTKRVYDSFYSLTPEQRADVLEEAKRRDSLENHISGVVRQGEIKNLEEISTTIDGIDNIIGTCTVEHAQMRLEEARKSTAACSPEDVESYKRMERYWTTTLEVIEDRKSLVKDATALRQRIENPRLKSKESIFEQAFRYYRTQDIEKKRERHTLIGAGVIVTGALGGVSSFGYAIFTSAHQSELATALSVSGSAMAVGIVYVAIMSGYYEIKRRNL